MAHAAPTIGKPHTCAMAGRHAALVRAVMRHTQCATATCSCAVDEALLMLVRDTTPASLTTNVALVPVVQSLPAQPMARVAQITRAGTVRNVVPVTIAMARTMFVCPVTGAAMIAATRANAQLMVHVAQAIRKPSMCATAEPPVALVGTAMLSISNVYYSTANTSASPLHRHPENMPVPAREITITHPLSFLMETLLRSGLRRVWLAWSF